MKKKKTFPKYKYPSCGPTGLERCTACEEEYNWCAVRTLFVRYVYLENELAKLRDKVKALSRE